MGFSSCSVDVFIIIILLIVSHCERIPQVNSKVSSMFAGTQDKCVVCKKTVYPIEKVKCSFNVSMSFLGGYIYIVFSNNFNLPQHYHVVESCI